MLPPIWRRVGRRDRRNGIAFVYVAITRGRQVEEDSTTDRGGGIENEEGREGDEMVNRSICENLIVCGPRSYIVAG